LLRASHQKVLLGKVLQPVQLAGSLLWFLIEGLLLPYLLKEHVLMRLPVSLVRGLPLLGQVHLVQRVAFNHVRIGT